MRWCVIGLGPVGTRLADSLLAPGFRVAGFDPLVRHPDIENAADVASAVEGCDLIIVAVPSGAAGAVAAQAESKLMEGALYLDWSSSSGTSKRSYARNIPGYIDVTLLDPIEAERPLIAVSGERSAEATAAIEGLGFEVWNLGHEVGTAADAKMLRSLFMKPLEALWIWWYAVAADNPARGAALRSIDRSLAAEHMSEFATRMLITNVSHAQRRAEELEVAASLVSEELHGPLLSAARDAFGSLATLWQRAAEVGTDPMQVARTVAGLAKGTL